MNHFRQHVPNFVDGFEGHAQDFETLAELLLIPCVVAAQNLVTFQGFEQVPHGAETLLVAVYDPPTPAARWVIGYLKEPVALPV